MGFFLTIRKYNQNTQKFDNNDLQSVMLNGNQSQSVFSLFNLN